MVCLLTLNIRGLRNRRKRYTTFQLFKKLKCDIICLQETFITDDCISIWEKEWGGSVFYSSGTNHSKGNVILISKTFDTQDLKVCQKNDRILSISFRHSDENYLCFCVYAPNVTTDKINFFKSLKDMIKDVDEKSNLIICGDFNCTLECVDNIAGDRHSNVEINEMKYLCNTQLVDIWRLFHDSEKDYTWRHKSKNIIRRLDYIFGNDLLFQKVINCEIVDFGNTDHRGVMCNFGEDKIEWGKSYWKLNNSYLTECEYVNGMNEVLSNAIIKFKGTLDDQELWDYCKIKVKDFSMTYGKNRARKKRIAIEEVRQHLTILSKELARSPDNYVISKQVSNLQMQLGVLEDVNAEGARIRAKVNWIEYGEKSSKYFLNLEKHRGKLKAMSSIKVDNNIVITDQQGILNEQVKYYSNLYKKESEFNKSDLQRFMQGINVPKLCKEQSELCDGDITEEECKVAIKNMKSDSSPGIDGLTPAWYKVFWIKIKDILINSLNAAYGKGRLSSSQRKGVISLLHKGKNLPRDKLGNWRPLSLTNVDYKILAKVLAIRFKQVIQLLINGDQAGFIQDRSASNILRAIDDVIEYTDNNKIPGILLALDYSKAFDKISKEFMVDAFKMFGFGDNFVKWICVLNADNTSCINYCGWLSAWFPVERGIRQGCPISPMCFVLACELLSCHIRQSNEIKGIKLPGNDGKEIRIIQFADDTTLFLDNEVSLLNILKII